MIVAAEHGFHGRTMGALALTGKASIRAPFGPFGLSVRFVPHGDPAALRAAVTSSAQAASFCAALPSVMDTAGAEAAGHRRPGPRPEPAAGAGRRPGGRR